MYTGKIQLDYATVIPLVSLADKYNVKDLLRLGLEYMARNVSAAAKKHQIVTWYQFATSAGHRKLAELTGNFIKWNFAKFVIDKEGKAVARFGTTDDPIPKVLDKVKSLF